MLDNDALKVLAAEYGTPLFVVDEAALEARVSAFSSAFARVWKNTRVCYSVKTNYQPWVVRKMHSLGVTPEVISGFELDLVDSLNLGGEVVVNGPVKTAAELQHCVHRDYLIHVDNLDELRLLLDVSAQLRKTARVGLRVRPQGEEWKRFGFEFQSASWHEAVSAIRHSSQLSLTGLHTHIGTGIVDLQRYEASARFMLQVANSLPLALSSIDMGGGFATREARLSHYSADSWQVPGDEEYARAIVGPLAPYLSEHGCELLVEPGRALIDEAICLLCRVVSVDTDRIIVDAGKNIVPSVQSRVHPLHALLPSSHPVGRYDVFGPLCMGSDCLGREVKLPRPAVSDVLKLMSVGAYCQSQSMQFIKYQAPMVVVSPCGKHKLVRRRQNLKDLLVADL
jgi:diaminopimelate decarboxylase